MKKTVTIVASLALAAAAGFVVAQQSGNQNNNQLNASEPMKAWIKANLPGSNHAYLLGNMLGTWNAKSTMWVQPGAEPIASEGTSTCSPQMTGRFVEMSHEGEMNNLPFRGLGYFGYNNATEQFENVWMDSSSTSMMFSTGSKSGNEITWRGQYVDPVTKQTKTGRSVTRFDSRDQMTFQMSETWTDGSEFKTLEIVYNRVQNENAKSNSSNDGKAAAQTYQLTKPNWNKETGNKVTVVPVNPE
jgi:hypothetical protein